MIKQNRKKAKHSVVAPELIAEGKEYTFSYNPELQPSPNVTIEEWFEFVMTTFNKCENCNITAVPELSSKGRLHYHGIIKIKCKYKFFLVDLQDLMYKGTLEIDHMNDPTVWRTYMYKGHNYMRELMNSLTIPYDYLYESLIIQ